MAKSKCWHADRSALGRQTLLRSTTLCFDPKLDGGAAQEVEGLVFRNRRRFRFRGHRCDDRIAFVRQRDGQNRKRRLQRPRHRIKACTTGHYPSADRVTRRQRLVIRPDQFEIANALDLVVVGDTGRASAKSDLGPKIKMELAATALGRAAKSLAGAPLVDRERPFFFGPWRSL
jgi:hypothetical protein